MRVTPLPIFGAKCKCKPFKRDKSTSRDFVTRGRLLRGQTRIAPLSKRSNCSKSIIDSVAIFYEEGGGGEHYRNKNKPRCWVTRIEKCLVKLKEKIWYFASYQRSMWDSRDCWPLRDRRARLDSPIKTRIRRAWKGFWLVCFLRFQELFLLELISCWVDLPKGWMNVVYFSVKICANCQNIRKTWASGT